MSRFRPVSEFGKLAIFLGLAVWGALFLPEVLLWLGGCAGGGVDRLTCTHIPDDVGSMLFVLELWLTFSLAFLWLGILGLSLILLGVLVEIAARRGRRS